MKHKIYLMLTIFLFPFFACGDDVITEIDNESLLRSTSVDNTSLHLAFPSIVGNEDNSKILVVYREGSTHISFDSQLVQMESYDQGETWTNRHVIYTPPTDCDVRDPQFLRLSNGEIICRFFERSSETESLVKCIKTTDTGSSYGDAVTFPAPSEEVFSAARGNMVVVDGVIYTVCYNRWSVSWIVKSEDNGDSWKVVSWLDERLWTNQLECNRVNETSLGYYDGKMYAVGRQASGGDDYRLEIGVSEDLGANWEWSFLSVEGQAPSLTAYGDSFILTYRDMKNADEGKYDFSIALLKDGELASEPVCLFESTDVDVGYGDVLTLDDSFLVCCYQPSTIRCYELDYDVFDD